MYVDLKNRKLIPTYNDHLYGTERVEYELRDKNNFRVEIILTKCVNSHSKHSLPILWYNNGYTHYILDSWWNVGVYVYTDKGCYGMYNPTIKGNKLDFDWIMEATEENAIRIIEEINRRANV